MRTVAFFFFFFKRSGFAAFLDPPLPFFQSKSDDPLPRGSILKKTSQHMVLPLLPCRPRSVANVIGKWWKLINAPLLPPTRVYMPYVFNYYVVYRTPLLPDETYWRFLTPRQIQIYTVCSFCSESKTNPTENNVDKPRIWYLHLWHAFSYFKYKINCHSNIYLSSV